jgi:hypothetical protein
MEDNQHYKLTGKNIEHILFCMDQHPYRKYAVQPGSKNYFITLADKCIHNLPIDWKAFIENHLDKLGDIYLECINGVKGLLPDVAAIRFGVDLSSKISRLFDEQSKYIFAWVKNEIMEIAFLNEKKIKRQSYQVNGYDDEVKKEKAIEELDSQIKQHEKTIRDTFEKWQDKPLELINRENDRREKLKAKGRTEGITGQTDNGQKSPEIIFKKDKDVSGWTIGMKGNTKPYSHKDGFLYIRCLLENPNKEIDCSDLFNLKQRVKGSAGKRYDPGMNPEQSTQEKDNAENDSEDNEIEYDNVKVSNRPCELATPESVTACKTELKKLNLRKNILLEKEEPEKGKHRSPKDEEELQFIQEEINKIVKYLGEVTDKKGNIRKAKDDNYRCRETVTASINRALRELNSLSDLLNDDTIETGYKCKYRPDSNNPPITETR